MHYHEFLPSPDLRQIVENYWLTGNALTEEFSNPILPEYSPSLVLIKRPHFAGVRVLGIHFGGQDRPVVAGSIFLGVRFHPWVMSDVLFPNKEETLNQTFPTSAEVIACFDNCRPENLRLGHSPVEALETDLRTLANRHPFVVNDMVRFICMKLAKEETVSGVCKNLPASIRTIQRTFKGVTGMTMKRYAEIYRLRRIWKHVVKGEDPVSATVLDHGYYDQAHFLNSFRKLVRQSRQKMVDYHRDVIIRSITGFKTED